MRWQLMVCLAAASLTATLSGCVSVRTHLAERERVDQELPDGAEAQHPNRAKTRQVLVVEVDRKGQTVTEEKAEPKASASAEPPASGQSQVVTGAKETVVVHDSNFTFPQIVTPAAVQLPSTLEKYTVQKDDTLQKISKKLYGSYSKWTVIYDANRDVIKDPNFLKTGVVLRIPVGTVAAPGLAPEAASVNAENK
ncbi:MAG: LysM peptidoglycan-binding domain-containing protein [Candidatus Omnitrophica bacterium]|nr:LysM peptidoglycan-binding domain-containing protein [Candidatus Omnitrophota bacterium]